MLDAVLNRYNFRSKHCTISPMVGGLINGTWKLDVREEKVVKSFILQKVNDSVFAHPEKIDFNLCLLSTHIKQVDPDYLFVAPIKDKEAASLVLVEGDGYYRLFPYIEDSKSYQVVTTPEIAFEAAAQFGRFTQAFTLMDHTQLKVTLPGFHDLGARFRYFKNVLKNLSAEDAERLKAATPIIEYLNEQQWVLDHYHKIQEWGILSQKVIHHDTKISNVLFNKDNKGICVIDLDTVMAGLFISDIGDMLRTYLCPVSEEQQDLGTIDVREVYFEAIVSGYLSEMGNCLSAGERSQIVFAGEWMIYMQALRFVTDYLENDRYYTVTYPEHNLVRAANQVALLKAYLKKEDLFQDIIHNYT